MQQTKKTFKKWILWRLYAKFYGFRVVKTEMGSTAWNDEIGRFAGSWNKHIGSGFLIFRS